MTPVNYARKLKGIGRRRNIARREGFISNTATRSTISPIYLTTLLWVFLLVLTPVASAFGRAEFRGAWVTAWSRGFLTPAEADATVAAARAANINALFIQVRKVGDAYYASDYEPRATNIGGPAEYDPLAYVIERAHREGIEVHAWINVFRVQSRSGFNSDPGHICNCRPEWLTRTASGQTMASDGLFLDPGVPGAQDYTVDIVLDIARKYDVDGIHLDYARYPGKEWGYNAISVSRFNARYGRSGQPRADDSLWASWRREQVTALVRRVYREINAAKPNVKLTAAAICWGAYSSDFESTDAYRTTLQDWAGWMREGIVDAVVPMNYRNERDPEAARQYRLWLDGMREWQYDRHVYCGQMAGEDSAAAVAQLRAGRVAGAEGMVSFSFNDAPARSRLVSALRGAVYAQPAQIPAMPWKDRFAGAQTGKGRRVTGVAKSGPTS